MILIIYIVGFFLTLTFFKFFGKKIGIDYDEQPKTYVNYDDYDSNADAYMTWSIFWFLTLPIAIVAMLWMTILKFVKWYTK